MTFLTPSWLYLSVLKMVQSSGRLPFSLVFTNGVVQFTRKVRTLALTCRIIDPRYHVAFPLQLSLNYNFDSSKQALVSCITAHATYRVDHGGHVVWLLVSNLLDSPDRPCKARHSYSNHPSELCGGGGKSTL